jgi:hypothetical protein
MVIASDCAYHIIVLLLLTYFLCDSSVDYIFLLFLRFVRILPRFCIYYIAGELGVLSLLLSLLVSSCCILPLCLLAIPDSMFSLGLDNLKSYIEHLLFIVFINYMLDYIDYRLVTSSVVAD